jgi:recombination protein RecA
MNDIHQQSPEGRGEALKNVLAQIEKTHGKGAIMKLDAIPEPVECISTRSVNLDLALGCGGYPRGRVIEIFGPEASGKTTLALHALAEVQASGGRCAFIDAEHAIDGSYATNLGVRLEELVLSQPDDGEQALDITEALARSGALDLIVVDSVAALVPRDEIEGAMGDLQVGAHARMMSKAMRKLTTAVSRTNTVLIFINQVRQKIGVTFGPSEVTTGGNALKFFASVRLEVRRIGAIKKDEVIIGNRTRVKVVKNKLAPPLRQVEFDILFGKGVYRSSELLDIAAERGVIEKTGNWYAVDGHRLGNGRDNAAATIEGDAALFERLFAQVRTVPPAFAIAEA